MGKYIKDTSRIRRKIMLWPTKKILIGIVIFIRVTIIAVCVVASIGRLWDWMINSRQKISTT